MRLSQANVKQNFGRGIFLLARSLPFQLVTASRSFRSSSLNVSMAGTGYSIGLEKRIINPLSPKSDQHQISSCNINAL